MMYFQRIIKEGQYSNTFILRYDPEQKAIVFKFTFEAEVNAAAKDWKNPIRKIRKRPTTIHVPIEEAIAEDERRRAIEQSLPSGSGHRNVRPTTKVLENREAEEQKQQRLQKRSRKEKASTSSEPLKRARKKK